MQNNAIPTSWYFDKQIASIESEHVFNKKSAYIGHELMVSKPNDYHVSKRENGAKVIFNQSTGYSLLSNICRHHEAIMLKESGNTSKIICPVHKWAYNTDGTLINAPRFDKKPCSNLENQNLKNIHGLLFHQDSKNKYAFSEAIIQRLNISDYQFHKSSSETYPFNWKIFMEVYLDNYHIPATHPGLSKITNVFEQDWEISSNYSAQFVKLYSHPKHTFSQYYQRYQEIIMEYTKSNELNQEIMWLALYPNLMIERYPFATVISSVHPLTNDECINHVDYFVHRHVAELFPDFPAIFEAAYSETAHEDATICELIHQGRKALFKEGKNQAGTHHPIMEKGLPSFYEFIRQKINK